jgi:hypothetical protein
MKIEKGDDVSRKEWGTGRRLVPLKDAGCLVDRKILLDFGRPEPLCNRYFTVGSNIKSVPTGVKSVGIAVI